MVSTETVFLNMIATDVFVDWAHFEDFCRRLTQKYASVQIFTGPLYLPRQYPDGKWRITYEVIGFPPSVAVPTHFFKVIVAEGNDGDQGPVAVGAFVLPNQEINNSTALTAFLTPIEAVERYLCLAIELMVGRVD
jgi:endonuclease G, mitochondrial